MVKHIKDIFKTKGLKSDEFKKDTPKSTTKLAKRGTPLKFKTKTATVDDDSTSTLISSTATTSLYEFQPRVQSPRPLARPRAPPLAPLQTSFPSTSKLTKTVPRSAPRPAPRPIASIDHEQRRRYFDAASTHMIMRF